MVSVENQSSGMQIIVRPNCSASWQSNRRIIAAVAAGNALLAGGFLSMGAWLVLPFMGLELFLLWYLLRRVFGKLQLQQIVQLQDRDLVIESGYFFAERRWQWPMATCSILVTVLPHPWDPLQIRISHSGETVNLGQFLNKDDSKHLLEALKQLGLPVRHHGSEDILQA